MQRITQKNPTQFVFESDHELESYFAQVPQFSFLGKHYMLDGAIVAIQASDPNYPFAYAANVKPEA